MTDTIPHPAPLLGDIGVQAARQALADLPEASENEEPYYWIGRLVFTVRRYGETSPV
jgi:hypothetical protein